MLTRLYKTLRTGNQSQPQIKGGLVIFRICIESEVDIKFTDIFVSGFSAATASYLSERIRHLSASERLVSLQIDEVKAKNFMLKNS